VLVHRARTRPLRGSVSCGSGRGGAAFVARRSLLVLCRSELTFLACRILGQLVLGGVRAEGDWQALLFHHTAGGTALSHCLLLDEGYNLLEFHSQSLFT
jgi:hypothetical protein